MPNMSQTARPCPRCGSANVSTDDADIDGVMCVDCGMYFDYAGGGREEVLAFWNARPLEDALRGENERLRAKNRLLDDLLRRATHEVIFDPTGPRHVVALAVEDYHRILAAGHE